MKILTLSFILLACAFKTSIVWPIGLDEVTLKEISSTKKTVIIDRGVLDQYGENMYAKFFIQTDDFSFPKIFMVAEGKLIKCNPKDSIWYLRKVHDDRFLKRDGHLLVLTSDQVKSGRPMKIGQRHVVFSPNDYQDVEQYLDENKNNVPDRLLQESNFYEESAPLHKDQKNAASDLSIESYEHLKKNSGIKFSDEYNDAIEEKYFIGSREVKLAEIKNAEDKKLLDSVANGYVEKINSQKFKLANGLYKDLEKDPGEREINKKINVTSVYDDMLEDKKRREQVSPEAIAKMERDGVHWSEDMDDATLRRYFVRTGLHHEERRRALALNELDGNEVLFHYGGSMVDHTTSAYENYRGMGYSLGLGYDLHLSRTSRDLKNWSMQFVLEKGVSDYDVGGINAHGQEGYYGAYLNYYFINNPLTLDSFIFLAGMGIKAGSIEMGGIGLSKKYTYQVLTVPALQLMTKYRFRSGDLKEDRVNVGMSLNAGINLDMKRLSVIDTLDDDINGKISINDIKYLIGMSVFF